MRTSRCVAPSCFETHRVTYRCEAYGSLGAAMLLSMRAEPPFDENRRLYRAARAQHVERDAMALVRRGNPAIERDEQQHVANLVRRAAVGDRAVEVDPKLGRAADRGRHSDRRERFCLERQRRPPPHVAIGIGVDRVLQRLPERAESFGSLLHRLLAEYLAA